MAYNGPNTQANKRRAYNVMDSEQSPQQSQQPQQPQQQQTFAQMQQQGYARPAPQAFNRPPVQMGGGQPQQGLDRQAIAADPQGYANWQKQAAAAGYNYDNQGNQVGGFGGNMLPTQPRTGGGQGGPTAQPPAQNGGLPNVEDYVYNNVFGYQPYQGNLYQPKQVNAPDFYGSEFGGAVYDPSQHQVDPSQFQTGTNVFGGLQNLMNSFGTGRGAMGFTAPGTGRVGVAQEQQTYDSLINPSRYTSDVAMDTFNRLRRGVDEQFGVNKQQIAEEMARRGIDASTIHGGRLGDALIQHDRTLADLAGQITTQQAETYGQDRSLALQNAMGYNQQEFGNALNSFNANLAGQAQSDSSNLAALNTQLQGYAQGRATNAQNFGQNLSAQGFNREGQNQQFTQGLSKSGFNNTVRQNNLQSLMQSLGYDMDANNLAFNQGMAQHQSNFNNRQSALNTLLGFGQNQFNNQLASSEFNNNMDQQNIQQILQLLGIA